MEKLLLDFLKLFAVVGNLALLLIWNGIGLILYISPAVLVASWIGGSAGAGAFFAALTITGLMSIKVPSLSRVYDVFQFGSRIILKSSEKMVRDVKEFQSEKTP
ncbi:hypothetical protein [uncultured Agrobacterium sp.]|uniref:hypothetical protein n=1 Tax=uncultured Agrobacterium sp. TaxID=157277 RepID=UPI0025CEFC5B|nr:hypothetical protein [uncultured Agrobacterium sp.]